MTKISYSGYRFPPEIIHQAIWLYLRFTLSLRDVEDLLAERGIAVSYETVRRWVNHFGPIIAAELRRRRPRPHSIWHLDEVYLKIDGRMVYLWRAVDAEGEVLDVLVQSKRNKHAALKLMCKLLRKYAVVPDRLVTDDLRCSNPRSRHRTPASARAMEEQSGREFASADPTAGAQDATLQERGLSPKVSLNPCRRLQHFQRRCHVVGGLVAEEHDENQLFRISVPSGDHSPGDLALSPVHAQLSRRRRFARGARNCNFVRNNPTLGESFRTDHCGGIAQAPSQTAFDLASGRGLSENRWAHGLPVARRRRRGRGSGCAGPVQAQQARRVETDAQTSGEMRRRS